MVQKDNTVNKKVKIENNQFLGADVGIGTTKSVVLEKISKQKNIIRQALPLQQTHLQIPKRLRYMLSCGRSRQ